MLRINQSTGSGHAKSYYSTADYYSEGQELTGRWRGAAALRLGLQGDVKQAEWDALCDNLHPQTGAQLTARRRSDRTVGYDFNFHVPKSVSLLYATTRDERLLDAFRESVDGTMQDIEAEMAARVRKAGKNENRRTGNMAWGEFIHFTSRPVDGVPDPHLHAHCFVFNTTFDGQEQAWKAGQFRELKRDAPYFEAVFHSRFAHRLADLGLPIERTAKGWELSGLQKPLIDKFSRRTAQIEEKAREKGIDGVEQKAELGAKTRERKAKNLTFPELQETWRSRMSPQELKMLANLEYKLGGDAEPADGNASARAVEYAKGHVFERKSVVAERQLLAVALKHSVGEATVEQVQDQAAGSDLIIGERNGRRMATTRDVLAEERNVIDFARKGRGACRAFANHHEGFERDWLNDAQKKAVKYIVESHDRIMLVRGAAGVGKTTLMQEAVEAIEARGTKVFAFAPSADASRGTLREAGFKDADTVARLLLDEKLQQQIAGQLIWIDEAGLLGTKTMAHVFALAEKLDARVLLSGDRHQHGSVERGAALRLLEEEAGLVPAEVKEIQRQSGTYKAAVKALAEGQAAEGFKRLDALGWVREIPVEERYRRLAADYVEAVADKKAALVVSPTHAEGDRITAEIRRALRDTGKLGNDGRTFCTFENANLTEAERGDKVNYQPGDVLIFHQNAKGFTRGDRVTVGEGRELPVSHAARFQLFHSRTIELAKGDVVRITQNGQSADGQHRLNNGALYRIKSFNGEGNIVLDNGWLVGRDFGHLAYGYVVTSHSSQGKTVDRVFVGQSSESFPASSREQFYVSASRAKESVTIYTDNKQDLLDAVSRSDERLSATELVNGTPQREVVALHRRIAEAADKRRDQDRETLNYER
jgi:conjugative relaxase-like TrwC/TraI family protein